MDSHTEQLKALTALFEANIAQYKNPQYDESNTRTDFIDKFFSILDWEIADNQGFKETEFRLNTRGKNLYHFLLKEFRNHPLF